MSRRGTNINYLFKAIIYCTTEHSQNTQFICMENDCRHKQQRNAIRDSYFVGCFSHFTVQ